MTKTKDDGGAGLQNAWTTGHAAIAICVNQAGIDAVVASHAARIREVYADILAAARDFEALVEDRNGLMHGKSGTDTDGGQRLFRHGTAWSVEMINDAADRFTACGARLNAFFYGFLA